MKIDATTKDCWISGQLAGIRMLERELARAFESPGAHAREGLRQRIARLNSWLNLVDDALTANARSGQAPNRPRGRVVTLSAYEADGRLPAA